MSVNSSSASNSSLPSSSLISFTNLLFYTKTCLMSSVGYVSITTITFANILLLLPLYIFVLCLGLQRWRRQRSGTTVSHSDFITYNMIATELLGILGTVLICCGVHTDLPLMIILGVCLAIEKLTAQMLFHILTCVGHYLAVVHPITYLSLRKEKGIRVRNISVACVWLMCFAWPSLMCVLSDVLSDILYVSAIALAITVTSFCSLSVLCVLIHPGPGDGGGDRQQVDQSKLRAFYTIMIILGVLLVRFVGNILSIVLYYSPHLGVAARCSMRISVAWWSLPTSLVSPLLFLQRAGKLMCCKSNSKSGQGSD